MVDLRVILRLVEFISCILYNSVALIVIPDCTEAITFYTKIVTTAHVGVEEQIQSLKLVVAHILLVLAAINVTLLRFWIGTEEDLLRNRESCLCSGCQRKERGREILKGLLNIYGFKNSEKRVLPLRINKLKIFQNY